MRQMWPELKNSQIAVLMACIRSMAGPEWDDDYEAPRRPGMISRHDYEILGDHLGNQT
jgi:hypothetical protein